MVNRYLGDMKADINKTRGARKFVDVAKEGMPRFDDRDDQEDDEAPARDEDDQLDTIPEGNEEEMDEPEPVDAPSAPGTPARPTGRKAARHEHSTDAGSESREPSREPLSEPRGEIGTPAGPPAPSRGTGRRGPVMPYPANRGGTAPYFTEDLVNYTDEIPETYYLDMSYQDKPDDQDTDSHIFTAREAWAFYSPKEESFFIKKAKRPGDEIDTSKLHQKLRERFTRRGGSREKSGRRLTPTEQPRCGEARKPEL